MPAVAGAEAGSSPGAEEGNLHQLVLHHTGAALLLEKVKLGTGIDNHMQNLCGICYLDIVAAALAEVAGAPQDP